MKQQFTVAPGDMLRSLCTRNGYFTMGTNAQYTKMFELNAAMRPLHDVALAIWLCSAGYALSEIEAQLETLRAEYCSLLEDTENPETDGT